MYLFSIRKQALSVDAALTYPLMLFPFPRYYTPPSPARDGLTEKLHVIVSSRHFLFGPIIEHVSNLLRFAPLGSEDIVIGKTTLCRSYSSVKVKFKMHSFQFLISTVVSG